MQTIRDITTVAKTFWLECAHRLPNVPPGHKCARLHGHSIKVEVAVAGLLDPHLGWVVDYADIAAAWAPIHEQLDHRYLNDVPGLENSTSEILGRWLMERLAVALPGLTHIIVHETCTARVFVTRD